MEPYTLTKQVVKSYENRGRAKIKTVDCIPQVQKVLGGARDIITDGTVRNLILCVSMSEDRYQKKTAGSL